MLNKRNLCTIALCLLFVFTGCTNKEPDKNNIFSPTGNPIDSSLISSTPAPTGEADITETPVAKGEVFIYYISSETLAKEGKSVNINPEKTTLYELCEVITDTLLDESFNVEVKSAQFKMLSSHVTALVEFTDSGAPGNSAPKYEKQLLDCIAQTILENFDTCDAVSYLVEGKSYESANIKLAYEEAYMRK